MEKHHRGILISPGESPIPAIGGPTFDKGQQVRLKIDKRIIPLVIADTTNFFPTFTPSSESFIIISMQEYLEYSRRYSGDLVERPKEFWLSLDRRSDRSAAVSELKQIVPGTTRIQDRQFLVNLAITNPLYGSSWIGLFILCITVISVTVLITLLTQVTVSMRTLQIELSVLSVLGISRLQMILTLMAERIFVTVIGLITGASVGFLIARWMLTFLDQNVRGRTVVPPVIFDMDLGLFLLGVLGVVISCLVSILVAIYSSTRLSISDIIRSGD